MAKDQVVHASMVKSQARDELDGCITIIPGRLLWGVYEQPPRDTEVAHYFNTTNRFMYEPFYRDFGPLNLSQLYRYCHFLREKLADPLYAGKRLVHWVQNDACHCANTAWLLGG